MSQQGKIKRYILILEKIQRTYPTLAEIHDFLFDQGFEQSPRTTQRDIEQIRNEFGVEIIYNSSYRGYEIDKTKSLNIDALFHFLELANTAGIIAESVSQSKETLNHISFEGEGRLTGSHLLTPLLRAIKEKRKVTFDHYNFIKDKTSSHTIEPYLLREYQSRWYVIGIPGYTKDFRTFGIDRITNLEVLTETYLPKKKADPKAVFQDVIGLNYSASKLERVVLTFDPEQGKYTKSLPLHHSQKVLIDNEEELQVELILKPNYEFIQKLLMMADRVKVIEPAWLVDEIRQKIDSMRKLYE